MLRICFMLHGFNLSDPGMEVALYSLRVARDLAGIVLNHVPLRINADDSAWRPGNMNQVLIGCILYVANQRADVIMKHS